MLKANDFVLRRDDDRRRGTRLFRHVAILVFVFCEVAHAQGNGNDWRSTYTPITRLAFSAGILSGMSVGFLLYSAESSVTVSETVKAYAIIARKRAGVSPTQLRDGLDVFFEDFRNRAISVDLAAYVVMCQIGGMSQGEVDALIARLRSEVSSKVK